MRGQRPVGVSDVLSLARELRKGAGEERPLVVAGAANLASALRKELVRDGVESAVREGGSLEGAAGLVYVLAGEPDDDDLRTLRAAERARLPTVAVMTGPEGARLPDPPYVLPGRVVRVPAGSGFPLEHIAKALARALGEAGTPLAARLPALRPAIVDELIRRFSRQNAVVGAAVFVPYADMPVLTANQVRLLLRIADAYGFEVDRERIPEVLGVIAGGLGFRATARSALGLVPLAGWAVRGGIAYAGTRAIGEAARRYFEARAPVTRIAGSRAVFPRQR